MAQAAIVEVSEPNKVPQPLEKDQPAVVSQPEESSLRIGWKEVLTNTPDGQKIRSKDTQQESLVSKEVIEKATEGLKEMALIFGSAQKENNLDTQQQFQAFADILKKIDQEVKFDDPQSVDQAVKTLLERSKDQAVALSLAYWQMKYQALSKVYNISSQIVERPKAGKQKEIINVNEIIINPGGTISTQEREMTYDEFIKTDRGQKRRKILGLKFDLIPISRKEFAELKKGAEGKQGRMKIKIEKKQPPGQLENYEDFLLDQLDLKELDPSKFDDFHYLLSEMGAMSLIRNEAARASGVPLSQMPYILRAEFLQRSLGKQIEDVVSVIDQRFDQERTKAAEEAKKRLGEEGQKHLSEALNSQLRQKREALVKELEKIKKKTKPAEDQSEADEKAIDTDQIKESLEKRCQQFLKDNNFKLESLLHITGKKFSSETSIDQLDFLEAEEARLAAELEITKPTEQALREELLSRQQEIREMRKQGAISSQIIQTEQGVSKLEMNKVAVDSYIKDIEKEIEEIRLKLDPFDANRKKLAEDKNKIIGYQRLLDSSLTIKGESRKLSEWLEEYQLQTPEGGGGEPPKSPEDLENEIAEIDAVLDYFTEERLNQRKQRGENFDFIEPVSKDDLEILNPELFKVLTESEISSFLNFAKALRILETVFSKDLILPKNKKDPEFGRLLLFLKRHEILLGSADLEDFDRGMKKIRQNLLVAS